MQSSDGALCVCKVEVSAVTVLVSGLTEVCSTPHSLQTQWTCHRDRSLTPDIHTHLTQVSHAVIGPRSYTTRPLSLLDTITVSTTTGDPGLSGYHRSQYSDLDVSL